MQPAEIEELVASTWDFTDPAGSERAFEAAAETAEAGSATQLVLLTQAARARGLQGDYAAAGESLEALSVSAAALPEGRAREHVQARVAIEGGRVLNSSGEATAAEPFFEAAFDLAEEAGLPGLAIDALHMRAIVAGDIDSPDAARTLNERALELAEAASDPAARRWRGSLLNNLGWDLHGLGDYDGALALFDRALAVRIDEGSAQQIAVARWSVARTLRSLGRVDEALAVQRDLESDPANAADGYIPQEIAACLDELGRPDEAAPYAARAKALLE